MFTVLVHKSNLNGTRLTLDDLLIAGTCSGDDGVVTVRVDGGGDVDIVCTGSYSCGEFKFASLASDTKLIGLSRCTVVT